jgi:parvulin-like peptidyl-prolyl isomerase
LKLPTKSILTLLLAIVVLTAPACDSLSGKSEYTELKASDLTSLVEGFPEMQKRQLAQNQQQRKALIDQLKTPLALAQAAEAEGLQKTEDFKREMALSTNRLLATEYTKRNPEATVPKEEVDAYYNAHQKDFEADFNFISKNSRQTYTEEQKETLRPQWGELMVRAERARQAGIEKDPAVQIQIKFGRINTLANAYSKSLEDKFKMTDAEKQRYLAENPTADVEKIKQKAQGLHERVKNGESFEKIADEFNEDDTKGRGGDLDWGTKDKWVPEFSNAAFALQPGQISDVVKSSFGFHIIRVDGKRMAKPAPPAPGAPTPSPSAEPAAPQEEVHARHIFLSSEAADSFEQKALQEKAKRAMEDATIKYPVKLPDDFAVNVAGYDPNRVPGVGGGQGGQMKGLDPNEKK